MLNLTATGPGGPGPHTYHPNTFGLLYGSTTKTACGKRVITANLTAPNQTTCPECQTVVIADLQEQQAMYDAATELAKEQGYANLDDWADNHRREIRDTITPRSWKRS